MWLFLQQIPVYRGCDVSILGEGSALSCYHGNDGLGDVPDPSPPPRDLIENEHAASALVRLAKRYKGMICT